MTNLTRYMLAPIASAALICPLASSAALSNERSLVVGAASLVYSMGSAQDDDRSIGLLNLDFPGGSATKYVDAVRDATDGAVNIIVMPDVELVHVPPIRLHGVSVQTALVLLDNMRTRVGNRNIRLNVDRILDDFRPEDFRNPFIVRAEVSDPWGPGPAPSVRTGVWTVAPLIDSGMSADVFLSVIETALSLFPGEFEADNLRFHEETALLLGRLQPEQIATIDDVLLELNGTVHSRRAADQARQEEIARSKREIDVAQARATVMERQMAEAENMIQEAHLRLSAVNNERETMRSEFELRLMEFKTILAEREMYIKKLEEELKKYR